ncbi:Cdc7p-Dbf4p kinase complex regulatory subunit [Collariella sp. IMI 366227]|nr:Cdc7p-Dbf4p kinase complex regulatory subunit [Collariella sp. IMI 366227]
MSTRRIPLSTSNPNVANSPMRAAAALNGAKKGRSYAENLREEPYFQPPPAKRQMIERPTASPTRTKTARTIAHRSASRATGTATTSQKTTQHATAYKPTEEELVNLRNWHTQIRARFPKMVFYFESIPDEQRAKLAKHVGRLGAREEKFFSIDITHVVTTRPIPPEKPKDEQDAGADPHADNEQPRTIDPSLLNRNAEPNLTTSRPVRRKLVFDTPSTSKPKPRSTDVLDRARDMGKKIWSLDKLHKILDIALHPDPYTSAALGLGRSTAQSTAKSANEEAKLAQLLQHERVHGPTDRDPTVVSKDMWMFRGPYIFVYDVEEKTKPIMIREYVKAPDPKDGDWPQFRVASMGRCPFVLDENYDVDKENRDRARAKARAARVAAEEAAVSKAKTTEAPSKTTAAKRTLSQMEDGQNRGAAGVRATESFDRSRVSNPPSLDFRSQNAFISHNAKVGRFVAGEPVASGLQPSTVTSAIRSQMISSTTGGVLGAKAGTSKEIHGLQRKVVLQKASTQDLNSRHVAEIGHDGTTFARSASASQATQRKLDPVDEEETARTREKLRRTASVPVSQPKTKRDPKPGYCENCQDKFADFEEHILTRKHRKFAESDDNWTQLDALLFQLKRVNRY